ncbi:MAG TPA: hypothetical protein VGI39_41865 [Polyangiaceae bacterium]|jgi:hypothetical protein
MADTKRRLTVLKSDGAPQEPERPPWHWVGFGTVMIFAAWLPLAYAVEAIVARVRGGAPEGTRVPWVVPVLVGSVPLALAALAGGFLVGRFGKPAGTREALLAGLSTGLVAVVLTTFSGAFSPLFLVVAALAAGFAALGGALGVRGRSV